MRMQYIKINRNTAEQIKKTKKLKWTLKIKRISSMMRIQSQIKIDLKYYLLKDIMSSRIHH